MNGPAPSRHTSTPRMPSRGEPASQPQRGGPSAALSLTTAGLGTGGSCPSSRGRSPGDTEDVPRRFTAAAPRSQRGRRRPAGPSRTRCQRDRRPLAARRNRGGATVAQPGPHARRRAPRRRPRAPAARAVVPSGAAQCLRHPAHRRPRPPAGPRQRLGDHHPVRLGPGGERRGRPRRIQAGRASPRRGHQRSATRSATAALAPGAERRGEASGRGPRHRHDGTPGQVRHLRERGHQLGRAPWPGSRRRRRAACPRRSCPAPDGAVRRPGSATCTARRGQGVAVEQPPPGPAAGRERRPLRCVSTARSPSAGAPRRPPAAKPDRAACARGPRPAAGSPRARATSARHEATRPSTRTSAPSGQRGEDVGEHARARRGSGGATRRAPGARGRTSRARRARRRRVGRRCCRRSAGPGRRPPSGTTTWTVLTASRS